MNDEEDMTEVRESGLAVVHAGEKIVTAAGAQAALAPGQDAHAHYHFPIHVVMVGEVGEETKTEIEARIWEKLNSALT